MWILLILLDFSNNNKIKRLKIVDKYVLSILILQKAKHQIDILSLCLFDLWFLVFLSPSPHLHIGLDRKQQVSQKALVHMRPHELWDTEHSGPCRRRALIALTWGAWGSCLICAQILQKINNYSSKICFVWPTEKVIFLPPEKSQFSI